MSKKIKILVYAESPAVSTGFGRVIKGIFTPLAKSGDYDIDVFGINDRGGWKDPEEYPFKIYPAMSLGSPDFYGRSRLINVLRGADLDLKPSWDIVFTLQDPFILEDKLMSFNEGLMWMIKGMQEVYKEKTSPDKWFKIVSYWPVDSYLKPNWVEDAIALADSSVAYTHYGKKEIDEANNKLTNPMEFNLDVIYHGSNTKDFFPISEKEASEFKRSFFKGRVKDDAFLVGMVARNQMRKDIPRGLKIFSEFIKRRPNSFLYVHAKNQDSWGALSEYASAIGLEHPVNWTFPSNFAESTGYPIEYLNKIYNIMDVHMLTTQGEGWGLPITEAMAAKTINLCPNHTSIPELFNTPEGNDGIGDINTLADSDIRGVPVKCASNTSEWATYGPADYERLRPLTNVDDAVNKLIWIHDNQDKVKKITDRAHKWIETITWDKIAGQWDVLFKEIHQQLEVDRERGAKNAGKASGSKPSKPKQVKSKRINPGAVSETKKSS